MPDRLAADASARRPVVGVTSYATDATWGPWSLPAALIPLSYLNAIEDAGGRALVIPPSLVGVQETLDSLDAIIFTGGNDIDPSVYGAETDPETTGTMRLRDDAELALMEGALGRDMPVLGICRGMQLINVAYGGTLEQHLPARLGHEGHRELWGTFSEHAVTIVPDSLLGTILGTSTHIKSSHHQAPEKVGVGLRIVANASKDGTREGVEDPAKAFVLGVLWHPEEADDPRLITALVEAARYVAA
jgi:putative glutamine amidotransferase